MTMAVCCTSWSAVPPRPRAYPRWSPAVTWTGCSTPCWTGPGPGWTSRKRVPRTGTILGGLARKRTYVNHYSFHIMDRQWGHLVIKMAGHAPFAAQVILNFTGTTDPAGQIG